MDRHLVERALDLIDVFFSHLCAEFVICTHAVALHSRLPDQDPTVFREVVDSLEIGFRRVDSDRSTNDICACPCVVSQELVDHLPTRLSDPD
ncbi:hypothetical protein C473_00157 [Halorubrum distributum JCM 10247]|uniref:Uncharacterized protein n=1 Tax=Halorubrum distributum JCM 10247 TaxID=1227486 RepID=M0DSL8_9EURY|nr:hypothetical protein C473_00157 [Halorubrum terrestre JCM 10247]